MIYLDTSALVKLLITEHETVALTEWLADRGDVPMITSDLTRVEFMRAALRIGHPGLPEQARLILDDFYTLPLGESVIERAATIGSSALRSFDALHLASASQIASELVAVVTYDHRLQDAYREIGLAVAAPGAA